FQNWPFTTVYLDDLKDSAISYLVKIGVISNSNQGSYEVCESNLTLNRLTPYIDIEKPCLKICPLHRYTFGFGWKMSDSCLHMDHKDSSNTPKTRKTKTKTKTKTRTKRKRKIKRRKKRNLSKNNRIVPFHVVRHLDQFPYGGRLCGTHLKQAYSSIKIQRSAADELNNISGVHSYSIEVEKGCELNNINTLLISLNQSPIKSQTMTRLEDQTPSSLRRLAAKLRQAVSATASNVAESIVPGQGEILLQLAHLDNISDRQSSNTSTSSDRLVDNQHLNYLIKMYQSYEEKNLPFNEKVRILTLIRDSWNLSSKVIQEKFNCSSHAVKTARKLKAITDVPLHIEQQTPKIRQRLDPTKIDYFINWLTESNLLISIPWAHTNLKLEHGELITIPRQMLQAQQSQIVYMYQQHCSEVGVDSMSDRTVYSILHSINASEQKFILGIDEFVKSANYSWTSLRKIIQKLPASYEVKNELDNLLENNKMYLKSKYGYHCGETEQATTHCTIFALSQQNNTFYSQSCNHIHDVYCKHCFSIFELFDRIENYINEITDEEAKDELIYDFRLVWDNIFQLMAHRVRAAQQEQQKKKYLNQIDETTAFLTVDWSQKILPQEFREGQASYFGKKGMSILVGSFTFKVPPEGRKQTIEEYVTRIRTALNSDGTKKFKPAQYLTPSQIQNQIKMLNKVPQTKPAQKRKRIDESIVLNTEIHSTQAKQNNYTQSLLSSHESNDDTLDEEDESALEAATNLENFRKTIIDHNS
ncbi:unnamed protein product, partial [Rotaria sordida]